MKFVKLTILALILVSGSAIAQTISTSSHNLSASNGTEDNGEICVYCHTPHNSSTGSAPLWNKANVTATFTMYTTVTSGSSTLDSSVSAEPGPKSKACLSCHDGTLAYDNMINVPGLNGTLTSPNGETLMTGNGLVGTDLSNDHPIMVDVTSDSDTAALAAGSLAAFLEGGLVECSTCHDVHDDSEGSFLRVGNAASALCAECHGK